MTTRSLPDGLQLKAGQFLTEFGRINPTHPHAWAWLDQPIINTRVFGPDGMRAPGVRLSWLLPVEWFSQVYLTVQNANGETMASFLASAGVLRGAAHRRPAVRVPRRAHRWATWRTRCAGRTPGPPATKR